MKYRLLSELLELIPEVADKLKHLTNTDQFKKATGSSHNHQAWEGGYFDHIVETMNIACWLYETSPRELPFGLNDALAVLFLHDLEKPFKEKEGSSWTTKASRRDFRDTLIENNHITLTDEQWNALRYVEGEYDDYSNTERKMQPLAAFCHICDVVSSRLWHDEGGKYGW